MTLTFDFLTLESCHVMQLGCSFPLPSLNWIQLTVPELGRLKFSIDRQLKVPIFYVFHLSNPKKALPWPERRIVTYCAWGVSRDAIPGHGEVTK